MRTRFFFIAMGLLTGCQTQYDRQAVLHVPPTRSVGEAVKVVDEAVRQSGFRPGKVEAGDQSYTADSYMVPGPTMGLDVRWNQGDSCVSIVLVQPNVSRESEAFRAAWRDLMLRITGAFGPDRVTPLLSNSQQRAVLGGLFQLQEGD